MAIQLNRTDGAPESMHALSAELTEWQDAHGYARQCASDLKYELLQQCASLENEIAYLDDFINRWELAEKAERA